MIKAPWPGMARTIYGDPERFKEVIGKIMKNKDGIKPEIQPGLIKMDIFGLLAGLTM